MAQSLDQKAAIRYAPEDLKKFIAATVKGYKESFDKLVESGKFSDLELQAFLFDAFEEGYQRNPEKDPQNKPYKEKSRAERMADPDRGINSPAFKKFMASQGM